MMSLTSEISLLLLLSAISRLLEFAVTQSPQWLMVKNKIETRPWMIALVLISQVKVYFQAVMKIWQLKIESCRIIFCKTLYMFTRRATAQPRNPWWCGRKLDLCVVHLSVQRRRRCLSKFIISWLKRAPLRVSLIIQIWTMILLRTLIPDKDSRPFFVIRNLVIVPPLRSLITMTSCFE